MSRNSGFVGAGCLWTFGSILYLSELTCPDLSHLEVGGFLAAGLLSSSLLVSAAAAVRSPAIRQLASGTHIAVALMWVGWTAALAHTALAIQDWMIFFLCAFMGATMADLGAHLETQPARRDTVPVPDRSSAPPLSAYTSGGFRALPACDSGSFRVP